MIRAVFDTNVVASATFWRGIPRRALECVVREQVLAVVSPALLAEYAETLEELHLRYPERDPLPWGELLSEVGELVFPTLRLPGITSDPDHEMVVECAVSGRADFLVTGDKKHLLSLREVRGVRIVSVADFLSVAIRDE